MLPDQAVTRAREAVAAPATHAVALVAHGTVALARRTQQYRSSLLLTELAGVSAAMLAGAVVSHYVPV